MRRLKPVEYEEINFIVGQKVTHRIKVKDMNITVNGTKMSVEENTTLEAFLLDQNMKPDQVVAAINDDVIDRANYESVILTADAKLDLMSFVGGG